MKFGDAEDWIFVSTVKPRRMPVGYTSVWNELTKTCRCRGIAHETLGWETGIEPATVGATVRCSTD